jgi:CheY-like chemotaxis protein
VPLKQSLNTGPKSTDPVKFVLLGEDDIDDEDILREMFHLIDSSMSLTFIHSGRKLIEFLNSKSSAELPCLIILDYNMPELNGAEILKELSKNPRYANIPKIIWSTSNSDTYKRTCLELWAREYLLKPSNVTNLEQTVRQMLSHCIVND